MKNASKKSVQAAKKAQAKQYKAFIKSPQWAAIRGRRIFKDRGQCVVCKSRHKLEVHHKTYERFGGQELMQDLLTLCECCHKTVHA